jgi:hypothetical protein
VFPVTWSSDSRHRPAKLPQKRSGLPGHSRTSNWHVLIGHIKSPRASQRMQICHQITELLLGERVALRRHHAAAADNRLFHESVAGREAAGKKALSEKVFETWPL